MAGKIRRCPSDGTYTLNFSCPACGNETRTAHPARYSPQDRLGKYRRKVRYG
ncbi:RNA-protein complex protein Nop10 [Methanogenium marinum]|uniref:Ribosome biogenesis protein Nop10 n=1 Tax=Methanogenium marinum TaxID=348610 RepID=A0A9Q4KRX1_9EURY|nr:RNA-protein complex protein Nop10 [Methanogenium marinum]MDE4907058.1 RNA-protein complex protein Nop10 [Methanogenium marinum]